MRYANRMVLPLTLLKLQQSIGSPARWAGHLAVRAFQVLQVDESAPRNFPQDLQMRSQDPRPFAVKPADVRGMFPAKDLLTFTYAFTASASDLGRSADVSAGVHGVTAERAYGTSGIYYLTCALRKCSSGAYRHPHQQHFGYFIAALIKGLAVATSVDIGDGVSLYDHMRRRRIPTQAHCAGSKLLLNCLEWIIVDQFDGSPGGNTEAVAFDGDELIENLVNFLGEQSGLLLLQSDRNNLRPCTYLQIERACARNADGADDDAIRPDKLVNTCRHGSILGDMRCIRRSIGLVGVPGRRRLGGGAALGSRLRRRPCTPSYCANTV